MHFFSSCPFVQRGVRCYTVGCNGHKIYPIKILETRYPCPCPFRDYSPDTLYIRSERIRCDYARKVLDSYTEEEFSADFRVSRIVFNFIVTTLKPHWKGKIDIETGILIFLYDVATGESYRSLATRFGAFKSTISKYFTLAIAALSWLNQNNPLYTEFDFNEHQMEALIHLNDNRDHFACSDCTVLQFCEMKISILWGQRMQYLQLFLLVNRYYPQLVNDNNPYNFL